MNTATAYIHLPGVALNCDAFRIGPGVIARVSFDQWHKLDGGFRNASRKYEKSSPAFWIIDVLTEGKDQDQLLAEISVLAGRLHTACLLEARAPRLPTPALSARYVVFRPSADAVPISNVVGATLRIFGPLEREWIVFGSDLTYDYDSSNLADVRANYQLLDRSDLARTFRGVLAGIAVLERTARPDSWWGGEQRQHGLSDFVHCMAACENILLPLADDRPDGTITASFGQYSAALLCERFDELKPRADALSDLYRLRSRLIHGRIGPRDLADEQWQRLAAGRVLLRTIIIAALKLAQPDRADDMSSILAQASTGSDAFDALRRRLG